MSGIELGSIISAAVSLVGTTTSVASSQKQKKESDEARRKALALETQKKQAQLADEAKLEEERRKKGARGTGSLPVSGEYLGANPTRTGRTLLGG